jgi:hypothetical protein
MPHYLPAHQVKERSQISTFVRNSIRFEPGDAYAVAQDLGTVISNKVSYLMKGNLCKNTKSVASIPGIL